MTSSSRATPRPPSPPCGSEPGPGPVRAKAVRSSSPKRTPIVGRPLERGMGSRRVLVKGLERDRQEQISPLHTVVMRPRRAAAGLGRAIRRPGPSRPSAAVPGRASPRTGRRSPHPPGAGTRDGRGARRRRSRRPRRPGTPPPPAAPDPPARARASRSAADSSANASPHACRPKAPRPRSSACSSSAMPIGSPSSEGRHRGSASMPDNRPQATHPTVRDIRSARYHSVEPDRGCPQSAGRGHSRREGTSVRKHHVRYHALRWLRGHPRSAGCSMSVRGSTIAANDQRATARRPSGASRDRRWEGSSVPVARPQSGGGHQDHRAAFRSSGALPPGYGACPVDRVGLSGDRWTVVPPEAGAGRMAWLVPVRPRRDRSWIIRW